MSLRSLEAYIKKNGKAKTAVALDLKETAAVNNWLQRRAIPKDKKEAVRNLKHKSVFVQDTKADLIG